MKQKTLLSDQENPRPSGRGEVKLLWPVAVAAAPQG
jgi:hypothetical protein